VSLLTKRHSSAAADYQRHVVCLLALAEALHLGDNLVENLVCGLALMSFYVFDQPFIAELFCLLTGRGFGNAIGINHQQVAG
jgi:hypothetical protein